MSQRRIRTPLQWPSLRLVLHAAIVLATVVAAGTLASAQSSLPEVHGLRFVPGDNQTLTWDATYSPAGYAIVMGQIPQRTGSECLLTQIQGLIARTNDLPPAGEVVTFLVGAQDYETPGGRIVNGPLGDEDHPRGVASCGPRVFVDPDATGAGTGLSWPDAYTSVARALDHVGKSQNVDVWLTGPIVESVLQDPLIGRSFRIFGGFEGTEVFFHERDPVLKPTEWTGDGHSPFWSEQWPPVEGVTLVAYLDGIRFEGSPGIGNRDGDNVTFRGVTINNGRVGAGLFHRIVEQPLGVSLRIIDSRIECDERCVYFHGEGFSFSIDISGTTITAMTGPAVDVQFYDYTWSASGSLSVRTTKVASGGAGLAAEATCRERSGLWIAVHFDLNVGSSLFECSGNAIQLEAAAYPCGVEILSEIDNNTFAFGGYSSIALSSHAMCDDPASCPGATNVATIRNNVFYGGSDYAVREAIQDDALRSSADATLIGNDLYDNGGMLVDEGLVFIDSIPELNAVEGNSANFSLDPLFASPILGNFHLTLYSPLIDRCTGPAPPWLPYDMDGQPRTRSVFGGEPARCDVGADEY